MKTEVVRRRFARGAEAAGLGLGAIQRKGTMKRLVVVADNPLIVGAIRTGLRDSGAFQLLGYVDPRKTTAARITQAGAEVVLVDEGGDSEPAIALIQSLQGAGRGHQGDRPRASHGRRMARARVRRRRQRRDVEGDPSGRPGDAHPRDGGRTHRAFAGAACASSNRAPVAVAAEHSTLTERETEILRFVASGATNAEIARQLWITQQTVKFHVSNVYRKLDVGNRTEACHYAHVNGLVAPSEPLAPVAASAPALAIAS